MDDEIAGCGGAPTPFGKAAEQATAVVAISPLCGTLVGGRTYTFECKSSAACAMWVAAGSDWQPMGQDKDHWKLVYTVPKGH